MTDAEDKPKTTIWPLEPISFSLTTEGDLLVEFGAQFGPPESVPQIRMGFVIPAGKLKALRAGLDATATIQETLSAVKPKSGAN